MRLREDDYHNRSQKCDQHIKCQTRYLALLLNQNVRFMPAYRTAYFMPSIVPAVASAALWIYLQRQAARPTVPTGMEPPVPVGVQRNRWPWDAADGGLSGRSSNRDR